MMAAANGWFRALMIGLVLVSVADAGSPAPAAPEAVWRVYADTTQWAQWNAGVERLELGGEFRAGARGQLTPRGQEPLHEQNTFVWAHIPDECFQRLWRWQQAYHIKPDTAGKESISNDRPKLEIVRPEVTL